MKQNTLNNLIKLTAFLVVVLGGYLVYDYYNADTIKIANWNLQMFGQTKASDKDLMQTYSSIIDDYDIIFIQEIKDKSETAFPQLCSMLQNYTCITSSRAGRTSNKEQYGIIYKDKINLTFFKDYNPDKQDRWERPPIKISFKINEYSLTIYNLHAKPDDVRQELSYLENIIIDLENVIILGDLNADCSYYNNNQQTEFDSLNWVIHDNEDTTSSATHCAYDRILLNNNAYEEYVSDGIYTRKITSDVSDHYLVWVKLKV